MSTAKTSFFHELGVLCTIILLVVCFFVAVVSGHIATVDEGTPLMPYLAAVAAHLPFNAGGVAIAGVIGMIAAYLGSAVLTSETANAAA
jgi:hypothetical protein